MAYNTATIVAEDAPDKDGRVHLVIEFTGNAGEAPKRRDFYIDGSTTALEMRRWAINEATRMTSGKTLADTAAIAVGQTFNLTPIVDPPPTQAELDRRAWVEKAQRLARLRSLGTVTNSTLLTEINALADDVRTSYQAGWIAGF